MRPEIFLSLMFVITLALVKTYHFAEESFNGKEHLERMLAEYQRNLESQELQTQLEKEKFYMFRQDLAQVMPDYLESNTENTYYLRNIASTLSEPLEKSPLQSVVYRFQAAKKDYLNFQFEKAIPELSEIIDQFPESVHAVEASYLLVESYYQLEEWEKCLNSVDWMLRLYPDNSLTGFALIRMAQIMIKQDRFEDADEVYQLILNEFPKKKRLTKEVNRQIQKMNSL